MSNTDPYGIVKLLNMDIPDNILKEFDTIVKYDLDTAIHCARVALYTRNAVVSNRNIFNIVDIDKLVQAGLLHDIGKTYISATLLNKPGKLSPVEKECIDKHAYFGYKILMENKVDLDICLMVLCHHTTDALNFVMEDATADIIKGAKILKAADIYDAVTSKRPYRQEVMTSEHAARILEQSAIPEWLVNYFKFYSKSCAG